MNPTAPMPSFQSLKDDQPEQFDQLVSFIASLRTEKPSGPTVKPSE